MYYKETSVISKSNYLCTTIIILKEESKLYQWLEIINKHLVVQINTTERGFSFNENACLATLPLFTFICPRIKYLRTTIVSGAIVLYS